MEVDEVRMMRGEQGGDGWWGDVPLAGVPVREGGNCNMRKYESEAGDNWKVPMLMDHN